ncbi:MAG: hypothetical protein FWD46_07095 [Cystobacterineae bacterium]|nr:hypothetical protein [Cystobacterineae bacterium]
MYTPHNTPLTGWMTTQTPHKEGGGGVAAHAKRKAHPTPHKEGGGLNGLRQIAVLNQPPHNGSGGQPRPPTRRVVGSLGKC